MEFPCFKHSEKVCLNAFGRFRSKFIVHSHQTSTQTVVFVQLFCKIIRTSLEDRFHPELKGCQVDIGDHVRCQREAREEIDAGNSQWHVVLFTCLDK